ncbi:MAG: penicillin-binding protein activator LpoB [Ferrovum sp.]|nr:penicillin-binding protein activator LpoB [Ferrovum sp.]NDU87605.1 penicillin-binding protein activator LpoB [Ferrovum sp.]
MKLKKKFAWAVSAATMGLAACSTLDVGQPPALSKDGSWALLPLANYTETPDAGDRVASIAASILQQQGKMDLKRYPFKDEKENFIMGNNAKQQQAAMDWASQNKIQYALTGSVQEWRYKTGVDGEPAVSVTFNLVDMTTGATVWSATGSRSGWSRSSVGAVGQTLIDQMLVPLEQTH